MDLVFFFVNRFVNKSAIALRYRFCIRKYITGLIITDEHVINMQTMYSVGIVIAALISFYNENKYVYINTLKEDCTTALKF